MNNHDEKYTGYALCREMWETADYDQKSAGGKDPGTQR